MKFLILVGLLCLLVSCAPKPVTVTVDGDLYTRVSPATNGFVELWEKKGDTNRWYTPSLTSLVNTNLPLLFVPLPR